LQEAIKHGNSHLHEVTLEETILKDWRLIKSKLVRDDRKNISSNINQKTDRNRDDADRGFSANTRNQQHNKFQPRQEDQENGSQHESRHPDQLDKA
jgi:hypothetical protein